MELSAARPRRHLTTGTARATNSLHPRPARDTVPLCAEFRFYGCLRRGGQCLLRPLERGAVDPKSVHDHGHSPRECNDRFLNAPALGDIHRPCLEPGPFNAALHNALGALVEQGAQTYRRRTMIFCRCGCFRRIDVEPESSRAQRQPPASF